MEMLLDVIVDTLLDGLKLLDRFDYRLKLDMISNPDILRIISYDKGSVALWHYIFVVDIILVRIVVHLSETGTAFAVKFLSYRHSRHILQVLLHAGRMAIIPIGIASIILEKERINHLLCT